MTGPIRTCAGCEHHTGVRCKLCGCFTNAKAWLPHEACPLGKLEIAKAPIGELWSANDRELLPPASLRGGAMPSFTQITLALAARGTRLVHPPLGVARAEAGVELVVWSPQSAGQGLEADNGRKIEVQLRGRKPCVSGDGTGRGWLHHQRRLGAWLRRAVAVVEHARRDGARLGLKWPQNSRRKSRRISANSEGAR